MQIPQPFEVTFRVLFGREQDTLPKLNGGRLTQVQEYIVSWSTPPTDFDRQRAADGIKEWLTGFGYSVVAVKWKNHPAPMFPEPILPPTFSPPFSPLPPVPTTGDPVGPDAPSTWSGPTGEATPDSSCGSALGAGSPVLSSEAALQRLRRTPGFKTNAPLQTSLFPLNRKQKRWSAEEDRKLLNWQGELAQLALELGRRRARCASWRSAGGRTRRSPDGGDSGAG